MRGRKPNRPPMPPMAPRVKPGRCNICRGKPRYQTNATQEGEHEPTDCQRLLQYRTTGRQGGDRSSQSSNAAKELEKAALLQQANADRRNQENGEEYQ